MKSTSLLLSFIMQGKRCMMCNGEKEKRNYQEHEKASFFHLPEFQNSFFILFLRKCLIHFLCACYYCVICSCRKAFKQPFTDVYKIDALKNLAIFTGKHLRWRFFIINFIEKRLQHKCFPMNIAKFLGTAFYIKHLPFIMLFRIFM